jgi:hypothetical protein
MRSQESKFFWRGIKHDIPLCCILFFDSAWKSIKHNNDEYGKTMDILTKNQGIIMCPDCLVEKIIEFALRSELV